MSFADFPEQQQAVTLLQRSLERGRLGHAYLFSGSDLDTLEGVARVLAQALNCLQPPRRAASGLPLDACGRCLNCRRVAEGNHGDVQWIRPESKLRVILIEQVRELMHAVQLKAGESHYKIGIVVGADRLTSQAANAFLKTLEEPPPRSVLLLLTTEPQRMIETILSRCLRLSFASEPMPTLSPEHATWLRGLVQIAAGSEEGMLTRYRLLGQILGELTRIREQITETVTARSPLERHDDVEPKLRERWELELKASIEAEYRRRRGDLLAGLQWWLRDVWLLAQSLAEDHLCFAALADHTRAVAARVSVPHALENLRVIEQTLWILGTNVQEALAIEVCLLKLRL